MRVFALASGLRDFLCFIEDYVHVLVVALHDTDDASVTIHPEIDSEVHEFPQIGTIALLTRHYKNLIVILSKENKAIEL